jgi:HD domain protein
VKSDFKMNISIKLCEHIRERIIPQYVNFDKAHRIDHVEKVIEESMKLALHYEVNSAMVYTIAAYHDLGLCEGREFHHIVSGKILFADETLWQWFTDDQMLQMKEAIEDHRASNKQAPRSIYGKIVAEADRIIDPEITLRRTVQYGLSHYPEMDKEHQYERFRKHLADKYAEGGYLKLWIPQSDNAGRLAELRQLITNEERIRRVFDQLYEEESILPKIRNL